MIINNVRLVLENEVVNGSVEVRDGVIRAFAETQSRSPDAMDGEGGWLLPGLIELHTDNLDKFFTPRPKVDWPAHSAMSSHDALMVASGITTVLDAVAIGDVRDGAPSTACTCAASCRTTPPCRCLKSWWAASRSRWFP